MALVLVVLTGSEAPAGDGPERRLAFDSPRVLVGRGRSADLVLPDPTVSARHASLKLKGTKWALVDEGSTNGTFAGRVRLQAQSEHLLEDRERVRIGRVWVEIRIEPAASATATKAKVRELALALVEDGLRAAGEPADARLVGSGVVHRLPRGKVLSIGSGDGCDVLLASKEVAKRHAEVEVRGERLAVRDLGSAAGTEAGGERVEGEVELARGASIRIGAVELAFEYPAADALEEIERAEDEVLEGFDPEPPREEKPVEEAPPIEEPPSEALAPPEPPAEEDGWRGADLLIVLVAIGVLGASLLGWYAFGR